LAYAVPAVGIHLITGDFIDDCRFKVFCQCYLVKSGHDVFFWEEMLGLNLIFKTIEK
jgi:hypothetical protein